MANVILYNRSGQSIEVPENYDAHAYTLQGYVTKKIWDMFAGLSGWGQSDADYQYVAEETGQDVSKYLSTYEPPPAVEYIADPEQMALIDKWAEIGSQTPVEEAPNWNEIVQEYYTTPVAVTPEEISGPAVEGEDPRLAMARLAEVDDIAAQAERDRLLEEYLVKQEVAKNAGDIAWLLDPVGMENSIKEDMKRQEAYVKQQAVPNAWLMDPLGVQASKDAEEADLKIVFPDMEVEKVLQYASEQPAEFLADLRELGAVHSTKQVVRRIFPEITTVEMNYLLMSDKEREKWIELQQTRIKYPLETETHAKALENLMGMGLSEGQALGLALEVKDMVSQDVVMAEGQVVPDYPTMERYMPYGGTFLKVDAPIEGLEPTDITMTVNGAEFNVTLEPDYSVWYGDSEIGRMDKDTGEFTPRDDPAWLDAMSSITAGVGDIFYSIGGGVSWIGPDSWGEAISGFGKELQREAPPDTLGSFTWGHMATAEWWTNRAARMMPFTLAMLVPGLGATSAIISTAGKLGAGAITRTIIGAVGGGTLMRMQESFFEAGGVYNDIIEGGGSKDEAYEGARTTFDLNMALGGMDIAQLAIAFAPTSQTVLRILKNKNLARVATIGGKMVGVGLLEGGEEILQELIVKTAKHEPIEWTPELMEVAVLGGMMGITMAGAGDVMSRMMNKVENKMTPGELADFNSKVEALISEGVDLNTAEIQVVDQMAQESERIATLVEEASAITKVEVLHDQVNTEDPILALEMDQRKEADIAQIEADYTSRVSQIDQQLLADAKKVTAEKYGGKAPADILAGAEESQQDEVLGEETPSLPLPMEGTPEAGVQAGMEGLAADKVVTPEGAPVAQASMDAYAKLQELQQPVVKNIVTEMREQEEYEKTHPPVEEPVKEPWQIKATSAEYAALTIEELDRAAFGFSREDITTLQPSQLNVKWQDDYKEVIEEQQSSGLSEQEWAQTIDLSEPIDVIYEDGVFKVDDGYHRYHAASILNEPLNVSLTINDKPHRAIIEAALAEGKPVPSEVLAEYPDLQRQQIIEMAEEVELADPVVVGEEIQNEIDSIKEFLGTDPVASYRGSVGGATTSLTSLLKGGDWPETITTKQANMLMMKPPGTVIKPSVMKGDRVRWEYVTDQMAEHFNMSEQNFIDHLKSIRNMQRDLKELEHDLAIFNAENVGAETESLSMEDTFAMIETAKNEATLIDDTVSIAQYDNILNQLEKGEITQTEARATVAKERIANIRNTYKAKIAQTRVETSASMAWEKEKGTARVEKAEDVGKAKLISLQEKTAAAKAVVEETKTALLNYVREYLPLFGKRQQGTIMTAIRNVKTELGLTRAMAKVEEYAETNAQKVYKAKITKELKQTEPKKVAGMPRGKYVAEVQRILDPLRANMKSDRIEINNKIDENVTAHSKGKMSYEAMIEANNILQFSGIEGMTSEEMQNTLAFIKAVKATGKDSRKEIQENEKAEIQAVRDDIINGIYGGKKPKVVAPGQREVAKTRWYRKFAQQNLALDELLNELDRRTGTAIYKGPAVKWGAIVHKSRHNEIGLLQVHITEMQKAAMDIFETKGKLRHSRLNALLNEMDTEQINLGTFKNSEGNLQDMVYTKAEIIDIYLKMSDPTLEETLRNGNKFTDQMMAAVVDSLTEQEVAWAEWQLDFYQRMYPEINEVFKEQYFMDMPQNMDYSPLSRDVEKTTPEPLLLIREQQRYATTTSGSLKSRVNTTTPIVFKNPNRTLLNHITQMDHFIAWAETIKQMRQVFLNPEVRAAIEEVHGAEILKSIDHYVEMLADSGINRAKMVNMLDKLRGNFTRAILGIKPAIAIKQLPSMLAYSTQMPIADFYGGVVDFWKDPVKNYHELLEMSPLLRERFGTGFERDIHFQMRKNAEQTISGKGDFLNNVMLPIRTMDKFAVMQGSWAAYQSGQKQGMSKEEAIIHAETITERTQPSFNIESLTPLQNGGSFFKLMTMFQNQPNKYWRIYYTNADALITGRGSRLKAGHNLVLAWVVLPMMFQFVADALQWDEKHQLRAALFGPLNFLLIGGQMFQSFSGWVSGETFDWQVSPVTSTIDQLKYATFKGKKLLENMDDIESEDVWKLIEYLAKSGGQLSGLPTPYLIQAVNAIKDGEPRELIFSRWSINAANTPDMKRKAREAVGRLGDFEWTDKEAEEGDLKWFTVDNLNTEFNSIFRNVLPDDIIKEGSYSDEAKSWAEKELASYEAGVLPSVQLYKINTDPNEDYTITYLHRLWQERQTITDPDKLKEFDKLYPEAKLGNVTRKQFALLFAYSQMGSEAQEAFLEEHPELKINPQDEWLKNNPHENALLALWGDARIMSQEAYDEVRKIMDELDITDESVLSYLPPPEAADGYWQYNSMLSQGFAAGSAEMQLIRLKDSAFEAWGTTDKADPWESITKGMTDDEIANKIKELELVVANREMQERYDSYKVEGNTELTTRQRKAFLVIKPEFAAALSEIEALQNNIPIDKHIEYEGVVREFGSGSTETMQYLLNNKDYFDARVAAEMSSPWVLSDVSKDAIDLQVKHADTFDIYAAVGDRGSNYYIADADDRADFRAKLKTDKPDFADDIRRIEAYNKGASASIVDLYVYRGTLVDYYGSQSSEVKLFDLKHSGMANVMDISRDNYPSIKRLKIDVKWRENDAKYEGYGDFNSDYFIYNKVKRSEAREALLENADYRIDRIKRDAINLDLSDENSSLYLQYKQLPDTGDWKERFLMENYSFWAEMLVKGETSKLFEPDEVNPIEQDIISLKWSKQCDEYEAYGDYGSPYYIYSKEQRAQARALLLENNPGLKEDRMRYDAYDKRLEGDNIEVYVAWQSERRVGYDDDLYLMANPEFYEAMVGGGHMAEREFGKVPTTMVNDLLKEYDEIPSDTPEGKAYRKEFRENNPLFDAWGLFTGKFSAPASESSLTYGPDSFLERPSGLPSKYQPSTDDGGGSGSGSSNPEIAALRNQQAGLDTESDEYRRINYQIGAISDAIPAEHRDSYVDWYITPRTGWEDDWYLQENPEFFQAMQSAGKLGGRDFASVPTRKVAGMIDTYDGLPKSGKDRFIYRHNNPELETYFVDIKGYVPVGDRWKE